ncbi:MAG: hypothetical protein QOD74_692 [Variibacter sp.]|jgi:HAD superfamily hydrolase (TIGR01459 family)|nr:hypothetical protein [Variibacter sp.]
MTLSLLRSFSELSRNYDVVLSDIWGVVHNGEAAWPDACDALARFRANGGSVVLISNAPRPGAIVQRHLDRLGVSRDVYDAIVTSGDVTRGEVEERRGQPLYHLGPDRDLGIYTGLDARIVPMEDAAYCVCSGLFDDRKETPDDYRDLLGRMRERHLFMICANPDIVVERGDLLLYCAGALADAYADIGGQVLYAGKPHRPIYDQALARAAQVRGKDTSASRVLAIGDSVRTDLTGAAKLGVDCLFVTSGIHSEEFGGREQPDLEKVSAALAAAKIFPRAVTQRLVW